MAVLLSYTVWGGGRKRTGMLHFCYKRAEAVDLTGGL